MGLHLVEYPDKRRKKGTGKVTGYTWNYTFGSCMSLELLRMEKQIVLQTGRDVKKLRKYFASVQFFN